MLEFQVSEQAPLASVVDNSVLIVVPKYSEDKETRYYIRSFIHSIICGSNLVDGNG